MNRLTTVAILASAGLLPFVFAATSRAGVVTVEVATDPPMPAPNVLARDASGNFDFEGGFDGWINAFTNALAIVGAPGGGRALLCTARDRKLRRDVGLDLLRPGRRYVLSCRIRPDAKVSALAIPDGGSGLGCTLTLFDAKYTRSATVGCFGEGPEGTWTRLTSLPTEIPEWTAHASLTAGLAYSDGAGLVDDIELVESDCALVVKVSAPAGLREVKVVDDRLRMVYYSGVIGKEPSSWTRRIPVDAAHDHAVFALDDEGDIGAWRQQSRKGQR